MNTADLGEVARESLVRVPLTLVRRLSPELLVVPAIDSPHDLSILELAAEHPPLEASDDSGAPTFQTGELHLTNDRALLQPLARPGYIPVYEGRHVVPFGLTGQPRYWVAEEPGSAVLHRRALKARRPPGELAYRLAIKAGTQTMGTTAPGKAA